MKATSAISVFDPLVFVLDYHWHSCVHRFNNLVDSVERELLESVLYASKKLNEIFLSNIWIKPAHPISFEQDKRDFQWG